MFLLWMEAKHCALNHWYLFVPCRDWGRSIRSREAPLVGCGLSTYATMPREPFK